MITLTHVIRAAAVLAQLGRSTLVGPKRLMGGRVARVVGRKHCGENPGAGRSAVGGGADQRHGPCQTQAAASASPTPASARRRAGRGGGIGAGRPGKAGEGGGRRAAVGEKGGRD